MNQSRHPFLLVATGAAFVAGVLLRFVALGRVPLSDAEATLALQALDLARGQIPAAVTQPGYLSLTTLLFWLFGSADFLARFWPAVTGSLLVLVPLLFRRYLHPVAVVMMAWLVAVDPSLVAISRTAGGAIFAITFLILTVGYILEGRAIRAGIFAALALLSGPSVWPGLVILAVATVRMSGWRFWRRRVWLEDNASNVVIDSTTEPDINPRAGLAALSLTLLLAGTLFFRYPVLLGGITSSLVAYLRSWVTPGETSIWMMLLALLAYEILVVLGGFIVIVSNLVRRGLGLLGTAALVALVLVLLNPARQVSDLAWVTLPLIVMTAMLLERWLLPAEIALAPAIAEALLTVILLVFAWFNLSAMASPVADDPTLRLAAIWSAVGLLVITSALMVWGWSLADMRTGLTYGLTVLLFLVTVSSAVNAGGLGRNPSVEMWQDGHTLVDEDLIRGTVEDLALGTKGDRDIIEVAVVGVDSPALRWALRKVERLTFDSYLPQATQPSIVITPENQSLNIASTYRGQDFVWTSRPTWSIFLEAEWLRWYLERRAPVEKTNLILWARADLFAGGALQPEQANP